MSLVLRDIVEDTKGVILPIKYDEEQGLWIPCPQLSWTHKTHFGCYWHGVDGLLKMIIPHKWYRINDPRCPNYVPKPFKPVTVYPIYDPDGVITEDALQNMRTQISNECATYGEEKGQRKDLTQKLLLGKTIIADVPDELKISAESVQGKPLAIFAVLGRHGHGHRLIESEDDEMTKVEFSCKGIAGRTSVPVIDRPRIYAMYSKCHHTETITII
jgi:hypothetical protein